MSRNAFYSSVYFILLPNCIVSRKKKIELLYNMDILHAIVSLNLRTILGIDGIRELFPERENCI